LSQNCSACSAKAGNVLSTPFWEFRVRWWQWVGSSCGIPRNFLLPFGSFTDSMTSLTLTSSSTSYFLLPFGSFRGFLRGWGGRWRSPQSTFLLPFGSFCDNTSFFPCLYVLWLTFYSLLGVSNVIRSIVESSTNPKYELSTPFWEFRFSNG